MTNPEGSYRVTITDLSNQGEGVARRDNDGKVVFVPFALPGEEVLVRPVSEFRDFDRAELVDVLKPSPDRVEAPCPHYGICGGCQLQHLRYEKALEEKARWLREVIRQIAKIEVEVPPVIPSKPFAYRNKVRFFATGSSDRPLGLKKAANPEESFPVKTCLLPEKRLQFAFEHLSQVLGDAMRKGIELSFDAITLQESTEGVAMTVEIRSLEERWLKNWAQLAGHLPELTHAALMAHHKGRRDEVKFILGGPSWHLALGTRQIPVSPNTFHQVNSAVGSTLYDTVLEWSGGRGGQACEAYCGSGSLSLELARSFRQVLAADDNRKAIQLARREAGIRGIQNVQFLRESAEQFLFRKEFQTETTDVLILDPPRSGMSPRVIQGISSRPARRIILVSCHPAALARDLQRLTSGKFYYEIREIRAFDMFPQTYHMEVAVLLRPGK